MIRFLMMSCFLLFTISFAFAQEEVYRFYTLKDSLVVIGERESRIPTYNSIAAKVPISLHRTPASVGIVTNSMFASQDGVVLSDALKNISGVNIQSNLGVHDYFLIRGFDSLNNGLVLTDGTREPEATFYNLYNIQRIEVLKGPSAFLYGGNPLSGTVNLVQKKPLFTNFSRFSGSYGNYATFRGTADLNLYQPSLNAAFRVNALYQESESYRDNKDNDNVSVNPAATIRFGNRSALTLSFEYVRSSYQPDSGLPLLFQETSISIPDVPRTNSYQSQIDQSEQQIYRTQIEFNSKINDSFSIQNKTYFTDLEWISRGTLLSRAVPNSTGSANVERLFLDLRDRQKFFGNQLEGILSFKTGTIEHTLLTGFEINRLSDVYKLNAALIPPIDLVDPVESFDPSVPPFTFQTDRADVGTTMYAPYFVDTFSFLERCMVFVGGRYDVIDTDEELSESSRNYKKFSPMFGFGYSPSNTLSFYGNIGKAFAPPSSRIIGDRKPEESIQYEVGVKKQLLNRKLNATLAFFHLEKDNIAIPDDNGVTKHSGSQRSKGVEFDIMVTPNRNMTGFLSYAYTDAELTEFREVIAVGFEAGNIIYAPVDRSGNIPAFVPKHILNLWITQEFRNGVGIGAGGRYVSDQFISESNNFQIESYLVIDASVFYRFNGVKFGLNFKNLMDQEYEMRGFGSGSVIPANPRSIYCSAEWSL